MEKGHSLHWTRRLEQLKRRTRAWTIVDVKTRISTFGCTSLHNSVYSRRRNNSTLSTTKLDLNSSSRLEKEKKGKEFHRKKSDRC